MEGPTLADGGAQSGEAHSGPLRPAPHPGAAPPRGGPSQMLATDATAVEALAASAGSEGSTGPEVGRGPQAQASTSWLVSPPLSLAHSGYFLAAVQAPKRSDS